jgi:hypothetical protein
MTITEIKALVRQVFQVVPGGPTNRTRGRHVIDLFDVVLERLHVGPNERPDLHKTARCYDTTRPEYQPGDATLVALEAELLCLGTTCRVYFSPDGNDQRYEVVFDPAGPLRVFVDGRFTGSRVAARWELVGAGSPYWSTLAASADDATTLAAYVSGRLLSYVPSNDPRLPALLPTSRTLWVRGGGQAEPGQVGNASRPFATIQAAHDAAQNGDVIHVLPGGTGVDAFNRQYYTESIGVYKNVTVVCAPGVLIGGLVQIGEFAGYTPYRSSWRGGEILSRFIVWRQFVADTYFELSGATVSGIGNVEFNVGGTYGEHVAKMRVYNCQIDSLRTAGSLPPLALEGRDDMGPMELVIDNTLITSAHTACIGWRGVGGSTMVLRGTTELRHVAGQPKTRTYPTVPYHVQYLESDWLVDQRPAQERYLIPQAIRESVVAGTFANGELQGTQPAGSLAGMKFTTSVYGYEYLSGAAGTLVWNRFSKA